MNLNPLGMFGGIVPMAAQGISHLFGGGGHHHQAPAPDNRTSWRHLEAPMQGAMPMQPAGAQGAGAQGAPMGAMPPPQFGGQQAGGFHPPPFGGPMPQLGGGPMQRAPMYGQGSQPGGRNPWDSYMQGPMGPRQHGGPMTTLGNNQNGDPGFWHNPDYHDNPGGRPVGVQTADQIRAARGTG